MSTMDHIIRLCVIACISVSCYHSTIYGSFVFDDTEAIVNNVDLDPNTPLINLFHNDFWGTKIVSNSSHKSYRPLTVMFYRSIIHVAGSKNPMWFRAANLLLYTIVCATLYVLLLILLGDKLAFSTTVLFTAHPIHTEVVSSGVGSADLLCSLGYCLSLLYFTKSVLRNSMFHLAVTITLASLATFSKEIGITVLGVCLMVDLMVCLRRKSVFSRRFMVRQAVIGGTAIIVLYVRCKVMNFTQPTFQFVDNPASFANDLLTRVLTYNYIYALNLVLLFWPRWLCFDWSMGCIPLLENLQDVRIVVVILFWTLVFLFVSKQIVSREIIPILSVVLLVVPFLPATNLWFRVGFVIAERVLFLPSIGLCLLVCCGQQRMCLLMPKYKNILNSVFWLLVILFTIRTHERNKEWLCELDLFTSAVTVCPENAKVHYNVAKVAADTGHLDTAESEYRLALKLHPKYDQAMNNLANLLRNRGHLHEAKSLLTQAVSLRTEFAAAWMNLGIVLATLDQDVEAEQSYMTAIKHRHMYSDCYYNLGNLYLKQSRHEEALEVWARATSINPLHAAAWSNSLLLLDNMGRLDAALKLGHAALAACPTAAPLHFTVANTLGKLKRWQEAEHHFKMALMLNPQNALYHSNLGVLYHRWGRLEQARLMYLAALRLNPELNSTANNLNKLSIT